MRALNAELHGIENNEEDEREVRGPAYLALLGKSIDLLQQEGSLHPQLSGAYLIVLQNGIRRCMRKVWARGGRAMGMRAIMLGWLWRMRGGRWGWI